MVQLFNAISTAQRSRREAEAAGHGGRRAARTVDKDAFLAALRGGARPKEGGGPKEPAWDVLKEGFDTLAGGTKMKDWDRDAAAAPGPVAEQLSGSSSSSGSGGGGSASSGDTASSSGGGEVEAESGSDGGGW